MRWHFAGTCFIFGTGRTVNGDCLVRVYAVIVRTRHRLSTRGWLRLVAPEAMAPLEGHAAQGAKVGQDAPDPTRLPVLNLPMARLSPGV